MQKLKVCWISAGVSSFVAAYLAKDVDLYLYIDIEDHHEDNMRFIKDCEHVLKQPIHILNSDTYGSVDEVLRATKFINSPHGAACTDRLKKRVRKVWEMQHLNYEITYVWGFDCDEKQRAERLQETMIEYQHEFPLIEKQLTKSDAHAILYNLGIKRPMMYELGYNNNNCVCCVKGGKGYWNKIRKDFPEVFARRAETERIVGHSCIKGVFLDELDPNKGRMSEEVMPECSIMCHLAID